MDAHKEAHEGIERRSNANRQRLLDLAVEYHELADRLHALEDHFDEGGIIQQLVEANASMALALEALTIEWSDIYGQHTRSPTQRSNERDAAADDTVCAETRSNDRRP